MEGIIVGIFVLLFSAILHEIAHGFIAEKLGDPTARLAGRLTLNPLPHIDPIMSIAVPALLIISGSPLIFGAAKPVPVNPLMLREGRKDIALVALAGPGTNIIIAVISALILNLMMPGQGLASSFLNPAALFSTNPTVAILIITIQINLALGFLNLIPIPPLDGSKFFSIILPEKAAQQYLSLAPFGIFILFLLLLATPLGEYLNLLILNTMQILGVF